jgi:hypothetical protein
MTAWPPPGLRAVNVALRPEQVEYLISEMLTDDLRTRPNPGAATVVRQIVADAIAAHKREQATLRARLSVHVGVDRARLMAGR